MFCSRVSVLMAENGFLVLFQGPKCFGHGKYLKLRLGQQLLWASKGSQLSSQGFTSCRQTPGTPKEKDKGSSNNGLLMKKGLHDVLGSSPFLLLGHHTHHGLSHIFPEKILVSSSEIFFSSEIEKKTTSRASAQKPPSRVQDRPTVIRSWI